MRKRVLILLLCAVSLTAAFFLHLQPRFIVQKYVLDTEKIFEPIRLVILSGYQAGNFGPYGAELVECIDSLAPDAILIPGNMFSTAQEYDDVLQMFRLLNGITYTYFITGEKDHIEYDIDHFREMVSATGVRVIDFSKVKLFLDGEELTIEGIPRSEILSANSEEPNNKSKIASSSFHTNDVFSIALTNRVELAEYDHGSPHFDLVLGGSDDNKLKGIHTQQDTTVIITQRLLNNDNFLKKLFSRPVLTLIIVQ